MDSHQRYVIPDRYSFTLWLFLSFSVLTFTGWTSHPNALARVSKSRAGDSRSNVVAAETKPVVLTRNIARLEAQI
jgi:hypothetical protein